MPTLDIPGATLAFDVTGTGPAVVALHAGIADRRMWRHQVTPLAVANQVVCVDLPGYGESTVSGEPFAFHDAVAGLLDGLGIEQATLVGCSFGGAVAIDTALAHPDRVASLALFGSAVSGHQWSEETDQLWERLGDVDSGDLDAMAEAEVRFWVVGPDRDAATLDEDLLDFAWQMDRRALVAEAGLSQVDVRELDPPALDRLSEIRIPTLVTAGAADLPDIRRLADRLASQIAGAVRLPDVPDAAHLLPLERPEAANTALTDFLRAASQRLPDGADQADG